jgi:proton-translocating NADH-quinone oxidoreductase chain M
MFDLILYIFSFFPHTDNVLMSLLLTIPIMSTFIVFLIPSFYVSMLKNIVLKSTCVLFLISLFVLFYFNKKLGMFQMKTSIKWIDFFNINFNFGIDGISIFFIILTTLLILLCVLVNWENPSIKTNLLCLLILEFLLISVFSILDLLFFYILFESVLIPMFLMIGIWGSRQRKIRASYFLFIYTALGSIIMLISILYIYSQIGTTNYEVLLTIKFSTLEQYFLWVTFFLSFATKIPMVPTHLWLPEAHVEAPTSGSVLLAGILLKLGSYGFIRFSLPLFPEASFYFSPITYTLACIGIVFASFTAIRQTDFKRIIAYTSIAHMNLVVLGIFSFNTVGLMGSVLQSLSHGFVASALFLLIGVVYDRHGSRMVKYYGGLVHVMPLYSIIFLFFTMSNIGLPGTGSFIGEFLILVGSFKLNTTITVLGSTGMVIGGCYSLWLFNRIIYGNLKTQYINSFLDLTKKDVIIFLPLIIGTLLLGIFPNVFLRVIEMSLLKLVESFYF